MESLWYCVRAKVVYFRGTSKVEEIETFCSFNNAMGSPGIKNRNFRP